MPKNAGLSVGFLFDDTLDSDDAVAQYVKLLGAWLEGAGHQVTYLVGETKMPRWGGGRVYSLSRNIKVTFNGNRLSMPLIPRLSEIKNVAVNQHFDVLHVMVPYSPLMAQMVINSVPAGTAVVGTFHIFPSGLLSRGGARLLRLAYGRSLKRFDEMVSVSQPAADFCRQALGVSSAIVPNLVDTAAFMTKARPAGKQKRIVFLGRLVKRKGCEQLIRAYALVLADMPGVELMIAGGGPQRGDLESLAAKLGISGTTKFLGHITESEKPRLLAGADVACFPSLYGESFGIVLIESMAAGAKTILGGDNPGYRSVLGQQPDCLVDPLDTTVFAGKLKTLLTDGSLGRKLRAWQRETVRQYDVNSVGPRIEAMYNSAIARTAKKSHNNTHA